MRNTVMAVVALLALGTGCRPSWLDEESNAYTVQVDTDAAGQFWTFLPDGTSLPSYSSFQQYVPLILQQQLEQGYEPQIQLGWNLSNPTAYASNTDNFDDDIAKRQYPLKFRIGNYFITTGSSYGQYVAGCVQRNVDKKYNVRVRRINPSELLFDLHLCRWNQGGQWCFGAYESARLYVNACSCVPLDMDRVKEYVRNAAIAAGVIAGVAEAIAATAAPIVLFAL